MPKSLILSAVLSCLLASCANAPAGKTPPPQLELVTVQVDPAKPSCIAQEHNFLERMQSFLLGKLPPPKPCAKS